MKRELNISRPAGIITTEMAIYAEERSQGGGERFGLVHGGQAGRQADGQARGAHAINTPNERAATQLLQKKHQMLPTAPASRRCAA